MKKIFLSTAAFLVAGVASAEYALTILHTNDFHARYEPITKYDNTCGEEDLAEAKCFGGSARLMTAIQEARAKSNNSILVDGGDQFQGTLFYTQYKSEIVAEFMNKLDYTAMTVGNHEFDDGPSELGKFVEAVKFPVLMSNADYTQEAEIAEKVKKSFVLEQGGEKIGFIGLTPEDTDTLSSPGKNVKFVDAIAAVQEQVDTFEAEGINKIIVLSHSGYKRDLEVAEGTHGVDVIVGGHTNTYLSNTAEKAEGPYPTMVKETAIVHAYAYGKFLGELNVAFDDAGKLLKAEGEPRILDTNVAEDTDVKAMVTKRAEPLEELRKKVVAHTAEPVEQSNCRQAECQMGNLVADAMLDRVKDQGIDVAIQNGGGVRASFDVGDITMDEILTVLPFQNTLATFQLTGEEIIAVLENGVSEYEKSAGRFPQVSGMTYVLDPKAPIGARISDVMVANAAIEPKKLYGIVSNDYLRKGGDGYDIFTTRAQNPYDAGPNLENVVIEYLTNQGEYKPYLDERITIKE